MKDWKTILAAAEDDYLAGLSNKGILKRAYKDMETEQALIKNTDDVIEVSVGGETVLIADPLGKSSCSCPSRSICRHIIQAILTARQGCSSISGERTAAEEKDGYEKIMTEIKEYPFKNLVKVLGKRELLKAAQQVQENREPQISYSAVVTVALPEDYTVKLLSPLEYSSCTCHKKELCVHKAAAILWCQLKADVITEGTILEQVEKQTEYDLQEVHKAAEQIKELLEELLNTGLSRTSPEAPQYFERLAVISHNAGLARFEGYCRALGDSYDNYFKRKASFRAGQLMEQFARLYKRADALCRAENQKTAADYAGEFRTQYLPVGELNLTAVAREHFSGQTGYEGETIYFLEENTKEWYTYTSAKPNFYETGKHKVHMEKAQAPWNINVSLENLAEYRIRLNGARCDGRHRLSSTQDTKGELIEKRKLSKRLLQGNYYEDFQKLYFERININGRAFLSEQEDGEEQDSQLLLVMVNPNSFEPACFSKTEQKLTLPLLDGAGRRLLVEVPYSKKEESDIRYLERITKKKIPCFFGKIYLRQGRICMKPIAVFAKEELPDE